MRLTRTAWGKQQENCWICGRRATDTMPLHTHEMARGPARQAALKEPAAWFRVCLYDHDNLPDLASCLAYKRHFDRPNFAPAVVASLRGRQPDSVTLAEIDRAAEQIEFWDESNVLCFD